MSLRRPVSGLDLPRLTGIVRWGDHLLGRLLAQPGIWSSCAGVTLGRYANTTTGWESKDLVSDIAAAGDRGAMAAAFADGSIVALHRWGASILVQTADRLHILTDGACTELPLDAEHGLDGTISVVAGPDPRVATLIGDVVRLYTWK